MQALSTTQPATGLPSEIQQHLGNLLKASYNDILTAPVPDRFMKLLEQFDALPSQSGGRADSIATAGDATTDFTPSDAEK